MDSSESSESGEILVTSVSQVVKAVDAEMEGLSSLVTKLMGVSSGKKIARIKEVRSVTGMNLRDAKSVVDQVNHKIPSFISEHDVDQLRCLRQDGFNKDEEISSLNARLERAERTIKIQEVDLDREQAEFAGKIGSLQAVVKILECIEGEHSEAVIDGLTTAALVLLKKNLVRPF